MAEPTNEPGAWRQLASMLWKRAEAALDAEISELYGSLATRCLCMAIALEEVLQLDKTLGARGYQWDRNGPH